MMTPPKIQKIPGIFSDAVNELRKYPSATELADSEVHDLSKWKAVDFEHSQILIRSTFLIAQS
jgi:hypothetical protein